MTEVATDPFAVLFPPAARQLPVAWQHLRVPGLPPAFALSPQERLAPTPLERFHRRIIQRLDCGDAVVGEGVGEGVAEGVGQGVEGGEERLDDPATGDHLALVDKAMPHARYDLMLSEVSATDKATPTAVRPATGRTLWRTGLGFVRFVSDPAVQRTFGLTGGRLHLALNCDPHTRDRESVQASKQFHLHLLYWTAAELAPLARPTRLAAMADPRLRRQCLDPLAFLGARLVTEALARIDLTLEPSTNRARGGDAGAGSPSPTATTQGRERAHWLAVDDAAVCAGQRPLGALLRLPGWGVLGLDGFEAMIRRLHLGLEAMTTALRLAFTGQCEQSPPWQRPRLLPLAQIAARLADLPYTDDTRAGLLALASALRNLPPRLGARLRQATPATRMHLLTLNQPCYALTLHSPAPNGIETPLLDAEEVLLGIQPRLFSGIGGAGLLGLASGVGSGSGVGPAGEPPGLCIPSVRVLRGEGHFSAADWQRRAAFQRAFAIANGTGPASAEHARSEHGAAICRGPVRVFRGLSTGWV